MLFSRIVYLSLFISSYIHAADSVSEHSMPISIADQQTLITRVAERVTDAPYADVLETMRSSGGLLLDSSAEEATFRKAAADEAFWAHYCNLKLPQEVLPNSEGKVLFANLLELIRDSNAPVVERVILDEEEDMLNIAHFKFCISCDLLFVGAAEIQADSQWKVSELFSALTEEGAKCREWFVKVLQSKDGDIPEGRTVLIGRLAQLADFLNNIATSTNLEERARVKSMLENNAIANADDCPDRAITGLDDFDFDIGLFHTPTIEQAIHVLLRQYKKHIIQECLVAHQFYESAQEYVYLLLLLNDHFNLGVCSIGILSGEVGARKTFDVAARMVMDNISIDGLCHFIAKDASFRSFVRNMSPDHKDAMNELACDPDRAEDALYTYVRGIIEPYIYTAFVVEGEKFQELKSEDIAILEGVLSGEAV